MKGTPEGQSVLNVGQSVSEWTEVTFLTTLSQIITQKHINYKLFGILFRLITISYI